MLVCNVAIEILIKIGLMDSSSYPFMYPMLFLFPYFFFQAEDGIRDGHVTGVQTCALPISQPLGAADRLGQPHGLRPGRRAAASGADIDLDIDLDPRAEPGGGAGEIADIGQIGRASCRERVEIPASAVGTNKKVSGEVEDEK